MNNFDISLSKVSEKDKDTIQNLGRFYVYEMSRYCGFLSGWEIPENKAALDFWEKVVDGYANGQYEKSLKTIAEPKPHPMVVLKFTSKGKG